MRSFNPIDTMAYDEIVITLKQEQMIINNCDLARILGHCDINHDSDTRDRSKYMIERWQR